MGIPPPPRDRNAPYHILLHDPRNPPAAFADGSEGSGGGGGSGTGASAWQRMHMVSALPHVMVTLPVRDSGNVPAVPMLLAVGECSGDACCVSGGAAALLSPNE